MKDYDRTVKEIDNERSEVERHWSELEKEKDQMEKEMGTLRRKEESLKQLEVQIKSKENTNTNRKIDEHALRKAWEAEIKTKLLTELQELSKAFAQEKSLILQEKMNLEQLLIEETQKSNGLTEKINSLTKNNAQLIDDNRELAQKCSSFEDELQKLDSEAEEMKMRLEFSIKSTLESELREIHLKYKNEKASLQAMVDYLQEILQDYDRRFDMFLQRMEKENDTTGIRKMFADDIRKVEKNRQEELNELRKNMMMMKNLGGLQGLKGDEEENDVLKERTNA